MEIPLLRVNQWLPAWDDFVYKPEARQRKPEPYFFVASVDAHLLRRLADISRRAATGPRAADIGIQRVWEVRRSREISSYIQAGYPWASLNTAQRERYPDLQKPGWLPTAVVANILGPSASRRGRTVGQADTVTIRETESSATLILPDGVADEDWTPEGELAPIEIIDGQHRLLAFDLSDEETRSFQLPVVFFNDLDISWQAYLFWSINIHPKKISPSLAYDLYPLLRTEDWLAQVEGPRAYRETRAQELTEALWSHPASPWKDRIAMLGRERGKVTQAAFVRSLTLSYVRGRSRTTEQPGGFFGAPVPNTDDLLTWSRAQQAAYLILFWKKLASAVEDLENGWAAFLREHTPDDDSRPAAAPDPAFGGRYSLLSTDQGVRGFLQVTNDLSFVESGRLPFAGWQRSRRSDATDADEVQLAIEELEAHPDLSPYMDSVAQTAATFDWRSAATPGLTDDSRNQQALYRGGTGYREVRRHLLLHMAKAGSADVAPPARRVVSALGY